MQSSVSFYRHPVHLSFFNLQTSVWSSSASLLRLIQLLPSLRQCVASPVAPYSHQNSASWCQSLGISGAGWDVTVGPWRSAVNEALIAALASAAELHLLAPEEAGRGRGCCCCASMFLSEFPAKLLQCVWDPSFCWEWVCVQKTRAAGRFWCSLFMCQKASLQVKHAVGETDNMKIGLSKMEIKGN